MSQLSLDRQQAERRGRRAETLAAWYFRARGWRIVAVRARTPVGEVDLIARRGKTLAFVEVKQRATMEAAEMSLDHRRLQRVVAAAQWLLPRVLKGAEIVRIDVVYIVPRRWPRHLIDVWQG